MDAKDGIIAGMGIVGFLFWMAIIVVIIVAWWKVFEKAGKPGWAAIIPIYNVIVILEIVGKPIWWLVLLLIPFVNIVILIIVYHELSKSFGKDALFTIGLILLGIIFVPILGFGDAQYIGPGGEPAGVAEDDLV